MRSFGMVITVGLLATVAAPASAESLEENEKWARQEHYMADSVKRVETSCGQKVAVSFDRASFSKEDWAGRSPNGFCSEALENISTLCKSSDEAKARVVKNVQAVVCRFAGKGKGGFGLANGTFTYNIDWDAANVSDAMAQYLKKNLRGDSGGESLEDKEKWARQDHYMAESVKRAESDCGQKITYAFDKASFANEDWTSHSPNGFCSVALDSVATVCRSSDEAKSRVRAKLKNVTCRFTGKGKGGFSLAQGNFTYNIDWEASNVSDRIGGYLKKSL